ncbi:hypothetical protein IR083_18790 [Dysgonomonas sp. GY75]|uniref:hypothetical protein n=1 Tax=Dysgonomonas sp. GY75 TaxID=2780419 RepID=UPI001883D067|nr:hypothetical protein [Dysgonomonas sp. GY75]MBF0650868.1 hypothetical protein [Dysgonomonas sp. GY75]
MDTFIQIYLVISLWLWTGLFLSSPSLRKAFVDMHRSMASDLYQAMKKQMVKLSKIAIGFISQKLKKASLYMEESSYELRVSVARSLISKELLEELMHKNLVYAISRSRKMDQGDSGVMWDDLETMANLATGKEVGDEGRKISVETAFKLCNTDLFEQLITRIPRAQERILLALDRIEDSSPYESVRNEAYRKFIRE